MDKVLAWLDSEPVATRIGPVIVLIVTYLLVRGGATHDTSDLILGIVGALFGIGTVASARSAVIPMAKLVGLDPSPEADVGDPPGGRHAE